MSMFSDAAHDALVISHINCDGLPGKQATPIAEDLSKINYVQSLRLMLSEAEEIPMSVIVRLNKAIALNRASQIYIPVAESGVSD